MSVSVGLRVFVLTSVLKMLSYQRRYLYYKLIERLLFRFNYTGSELSTTSRKYNLLRSRL